MSLTNTPDRIWSWINSIDSPPPRERITVVPKGKTERHALTVTSNNIMSGNRYNLRNRREVLNHTDTATMADRSILHHDENETPKARHILDTATRLPPPTYYPSSTSRGTVTTQSTSNSTRSRSPVKRFRDLKGALIPTTYEILNVKVADEIGGVLGRFKSLFETSMGIGVIPNSLKSVVEESCHEHYRLPPFVYAQSHESTDIRRYEQILGEKASEINTQALIFEKDQACEASWNGGVQFPLLQLIKQHPKYKSSVGFENITAARIQPPSLSMNHDSGIMMQDKMVDFAVYLQPSQEMEKKIENVLRGKDARSRSVNQTLFGSLDSRPIALFMETKLPSSGVEKSNIQMAVWMGAGMQRLRQMLDENGRYSEAIPAMPALSMHGHDLHLSVFKFEPEKTIMYGRYRLGGSDTLLGVFQIIKALDILFEWAHEDFRSWYDEKVLTPLA